MLSKLRKEKWFIGSLEKGLAVIETFGGVRSPQSVSQIAARAGVSRASARRIAMTLEALGYLARDGHNCYALTPRTLALGTAYLSSHAVGDGIQPILARLRDFSGRSASLAVLDGQDIIYVARASATGPLRIDINVGHRLPAYATAMGRILLAALDEPAFEAWLDGARLEPLTEATVCDKAQFRDTIVTIRKEGYCRINGELAPGIRVLAVPVVSSGGETMAAMNCTTQSPFDRERDDIAELLPEMRRAAAEISSVWNHFHMRTSHDVLGDIAPARTQQAGRDGQNAMGRVQPDPTSSSTRS